MNTIIDIRGKQYNVKKGDVIAIDKIDNKENEKIEFNNILMVNDNKELKIGTPYVKDVSVQAKVLEHVRDKKVIVFKFKRRKNYKRLKGHKQPYTMIKIEKILTK
ncbi:MAG: 50S ribosomal protein L21 [Spirochaetes bacterium]|nr:50S ribosomal protein L21 [Spirochaetota bacterium]